MMIEPLRLFANETTDIQWFRDAAGNPIGGRGNVLSIQITGPATWATAVYRVVARVHPSVPKPVALSPTLSLTAAAPYQLQIDIAGLADIGLELTTAEGSTLELTGHAFLGVA